MRSEREVRQGYILFPTLFSLYTEEMAAKMRRMNAEVNVDGDKIYLLLYADDVVVMSETAEELKILLDVIKGYWRDFFRRDKSKIMIVNRSVDERDTVWSLGENELEQTREHKYLGMCMCLYGCKRIKKQKISQLNQWV